MYLMTNHFFPLTDKEKTIFFGGIHFDNPKGKEEIDKIANILKDANHFCKRPFPEETYQVGIEFITLRSILNEFMINHIDNERKSNIKYTKNVYRDLAKLWVIVRFNDTIIETTQEYKKVGKEYEDDDVSPLSGTYFQSIEFVTNRIAFLDFMCNNSILTSILFKNADEISSKSQIRLYPELIIRSHKNNKVTTAPTRYLPFNIVYEYYMRIIKEVGPRFNTEKFNFICDSISSMKKIYFLNKDLFNIQMISIIEFLLTHNPDYNRYNVEESISKQFVGKLNLVLYEYFDGYHEKLDKELKLAYSIRSDIAHGNFADKRKQLIKLGKLFKTKATKSATVGDLCEEVMLTLNNNIELYIRVLLNLYLKNEYKLKILKKS